MKYFGVFKKMLDDPIISDPIYDHEEIPTYKIGKEAWELFLFANRQNWIMHLVSPGSLLILKEEVTREIFQKYLEFLTTSVHFQVYKSEFEMNCFLHKTKDDQIQYCKEYIAKQEIFANEFCIPVFDSKNNSLYIETDRINFLLTFLPLTVEKFLYGVEYDHTLSFGLSFIDHSILKYLKVKMAFDQINSLSTEQVKNNTEKAEYSTLQKAIVFQQLGFYRIIQDRNIKGPVNFIADILGINQSNFRNSWAQAAKDISSDGSIRKRDGKTDITVYEDILKIIKSK